MGIEALASALGTMRVALEEGVLTLTLDRPDRLNAFTTRMGEEWLEVLDAMLVFQDAVAEAGSAEGDCAEENCPSRPPARRARARAAAFSGRWASDPKIVS